MIKNFIKTILIRLKIRRAESLAKLTGYKYYVVFYSGKFRILSKVDAKKLIKSHFFKKGTTIETIERMAIYTTIKQRSK